MYLDDDEIGRRATINNNIENTKKAVGHQLKRNIFSQNGILLASEKAVINHENLQILEKHGIKLTEEDITTFGPYLITDSEQDHVMNEAVSKVRSLFDEVRHHKIVPIADIRTKIVPTINDAIGDSQLYGLLASLQAKDDYTYRHHIAVGIISTLLGKWTGLEGRELSQLTTAALLHDVGKMLVPEDILNKPGSLTNEEYEIMKYHAVFGYELLKGTVGISHRQALVALQHHERMDGSGYPFGITGEKIDFLSRIVAVADVFHAMTSARVYRQPMPFYEVVTQMQRDTYGVLDPKLTRIFIDKIMHSFIGREVELTDQRAGIIVFVHQDDPVRPLIQTDDEFIDLRKERMIQIKQIK